MGGSNTWRTPLTGEDWMREVEKRILHEERRPMVRTASDLLGPGIAPFSILINDWNDSQTSFNGYFHSEPNALNTPDSSKYWMGTSQATEEGFGIQRVTEYFGPSVEAKWPQPVYVRRFYTGGQAGTQRQFSPWALEAGDDGTGSTVVTADGIGGDGSLATPVVAKTSGTYGTAPLDSTMVGDIPSAMGREIYVDSAGQLRSRPDVTTFDTIPKPVTDLPSTYRLGVTLMTLSTAAATAGGWPGNLTAYVLTTARYDTGGVVSASQYWMRNSTSFAQVYYRSGTASGWTTWRTVYLANEQIPPSADLNTYVNPGQYAQTSNADAASGSNYPIPNAGMLEVGASDGGNMVWQRYTIYRAGSTIAGMTYQRSFYSAAWSAWAITAGEPLLPDSADTYVGNDQTISATSRYTELPTAVRATIANPHLSRRMLCRVSATCWVDMVTQGIYFDVINIAGVTWAGRQNNGRWENYPPVTHSYSSMLAEAMIWVPAGTSATVGLGSAKTQSANASPTMRYTQIQIMPIRYE